MVKLLPSKQRVVNILRDVSGIVKPSRYEVFTCECSKYLTVADDPILKR